jgi:predicted Zn-dependent peptidase
VKAGLKSSLIMQQESTAARASVLARNWFNLGRVRTVQETAAEIDRLSPDSILSYLERRPLKEIGIMTLGPGKVEIPQ